jgi:hypothetical protein
VPAEHGGEDQRVHPTLLPGHRVEDEPHLGEVDLALDPGLAVVDPDRGGADAEAAPLDREPVQGAVWHHAPLPGEQFLDLHDRQRRLAITAGHPLGDLLLPGEQQLPRRAVSVRARRADRGHHRADQLIGQRLDTVVAAQALGLGRSDVPASRLAIHPRPFGDLAQTGPFEPTPEHLSYLNHTDLPESHA